MYYWDVICAKKALALIHVDIWRKFEEKWSKKLWVQYWITFISTNRNTEMFLVVLSNLTT